ncbi:MAG TPA: polysaccharide deacetylase family protein [Dermatophilaceae bacterium]|nr:polysaccharide deacetylase family protein [Dermatophilaceae bacterium]
MDVSRRETLALGSGIAIGALGLGLGLEIKDRLDENTPLPFYGSPVSAVHPDRSAPGAASASVVWSGSTSGRRIALTFDDGPDPDWTPDVLSALRREGVPATFFCVGQNVVDHGAIHRDSVGTHELASHGFDRVDFGRLPLDRCRDQLERTAALLKDTYGSAPTLFRPPYGHHGGAALLAAAELGLTTTFWSAQAREDLFRDDPDGIVADLTRQVRPGSIVLMHDVGSEDRRITIRHLEPLVRSLRDARWSFVTVSELLANP